MPRERVSTTQSDCQREAMIIESLISAAAVLDNEGEGNTVTALLEVARQRAAQLNYDLDSVHGRLTDD